MILILVLAPPTLGVRGTCPHLPSPSYATDDEECLMQGFMDLSDHQFALHCVSLKVPFLLPNWGGGTTSIRSASTLDSFEFTLKNILFRKIISMKCDGFFLSRLVMHYSTIEIVAFIIVVIIIIIIINLINSSSNINNGADVHIWILFKRPSFSK